MPTRSLLLGLTLVAALTATSPATPPPIEPVVKTGNECLALWAVYWEKVARGEPAIPPDCIP